MYKDQIDSITRLKKKLSKTNFNQTILTKTEILNILSETNIASPYRRNELRN